MEIWNIKTKLPKRYLANVNNLVAKTHLNPLPGGLHHSQCPEIFPKEFQSGKFLAFSRFEYPVSLLAIQNLVNSIFNLTTTFKLSFSEVKFSGIDASAFNRLKKGIFILLWFFLLIRAYLPNFLLTNLATVFFNCFFHVYRGITQHDCAWHLDQFLSIFEGYFLRVFLFNRIWCNCNFRLYWV